MNSPANSNKTTLGQSYLFFRISQLLGLVVESCCKPGLEQKTDNQNELDVLGEIRLRNI